MRHMSFAATTAQILDRTKTVTRRCGWRDLKPGTLIQAVEKGQGLKKGERVRRLAVLRVTDVRREVLAFMDDADVAREGFPQMTAAEFISMFVGLNDCPTSTVEVTRIAFEYAEPSGASA